jgi:hypothetical protein
MSNFADLVRAQRQSGAGVLGSLGAAYNQQMLEKLDPRNKLFSRKGTLVALFPGLKGYQASAKTSSIKGGSIGSTSFGSVETITRLDSIAKDSKISAKNSMVLPMMARDFNLVRQNIAKLVKLQGGTAANRADMFFKRSGERESLYESKFGKLGSGGKKSGSIPSNKSGGGGGILSLLGGLFSGVGNVAGGLLGGIGSLGAGLLGGLGSLAGGIGSVVGSVVSGLSSVIGGVAGGIFSGLGSIFGAMGFLGILAAAATGFILYQLTKSIDFEKLGKEFDVGGTWSTMTQALEKLTEKFTKGADELTGGAFSDTMFAIRKGFRDIVVTTVATIKTGMEIMSNVFIGAVKDSIGITKNFYDDHESDILAGVAAIGAMTVLGGIGLIGGGAGGAALGVGAGMITGGLLGTLIDAYKSMRPGSSDNIQKLEEQLSGYQGRKAKLERDKKESKYDWQRNNVDEMLRANEDNIKATQAKIDAVKKVKEGRTGNLQKALEDMMNPGKVYDRVKSEVDALTPSVIRKGSALSGENIRDVIGQAEGGKTGYNAVFGDQGKLSADVQKFFGGKNISEVTIGEAIKYGRSRADGQTAVGKFQFVAKTLEDPNLLKRAGLTLDDPFNASNQNKLYNAFHNQNMEYLQKNGFEASAENMYLAHYLGARGAVAFLNANPNASAASVYKQLYPKANMDVVLKNNKPLQGSVADTISYTSGMFSKYRSDTSLADSSINSLTPRQNAGTLLNTGSAEMERAKFAAVSGTNVINSFNNTNVAGKEKESTAPPVSSPFNEEMFFREQMKSMLFQ